MTSSVFGFCSQANGVHISIGDVACATSDSSPDIMKVHLHHLNPTQTRIINLASFLCLPSPHIIYWSLRDALPALQPQRYCSAACSVILSTFLLCPAGLRLIALPASCGFLHPPFQIWLRIGLSLGQLVSKWHLIAYYLSNSASLCKIVSHSGKKKEKRGAEWKAKAKYIKKRRENISVPLHCCSQEADRSVLSWSFIHTVKIFVCTHCLHVSEAGWADCVDHLQGLWSRGWNQSTR